MPLGPRFDTEFQARKTAQLESNPKKKSKNVGIIIFIIVIALCALIYWIFISPSGFFSSTPAPKINTTYIPVFKIPPNVTNQSYNYTNTVDSYTQNSFYNFSQSYYGIQNASVTNTTLAFVPTCGDHLCSANESCSTCQKDCGLCEEDIANGIKQSIVWVKYDLAEKTSLGTVQTSGGSGSGIIYKISNSKMQVITNRHVVDCLYVGESCYQRINETVQVRTQDGKIYPVSKVLLAPHDIDMAILEVPIQTQYKTASIRKTSLAVGEKVIAVGYPSFNEWLLEFSYKNGTVTGFRELLTFDGFPLNAIDSTAYTYFGSSGGGLFDKDGNLVGINTWLGEQKGSTAINIELIERFENLSYCQNSFFVGGNCIPYCNSTQALGEDAKCYEKCSGFYCNSNIPTVTASQNCTNNTILGTDNLCHKPCGNATSYCPQTNSVCLKDECVLPCTQGYLYADNTCRY